MELYAARVWFTPHTVSYTVEYTVCRYNRGWWWIAWDIRAVKINMRFV